MKEKSLTTKVISITMLILFQQIYVYLIAFIVGLLNIPIPKGPTFLWIFNMVVNFSFMILMLFLFIRTIQEDYYDFKTNFKKYLNENIKYWMIGLGLMILSNLFIYMIYRTGASNEEVVQETIKKFPIYMIFATVFYAPFVEELIYRKAINYLFTNDIIYIIASGLLFGGVHILTNPNQYLYIIPYGVVGSMFAIMYTKTRNVFVPMTFHFIHNTMILMMSLLLR